jgi:hypothetical protein
MTPKTFSALSLLSNLNNGTTTTAVTMQYDHPEAEQRHVETIGGSFFDSRGDQSSKRKPSRRIVRFLLTTETSSSLHSHINTLEFDDVGNKGTLIFTGDDGNEYFCTAVLQKVDVRFLFDTPQQEAAEITLAVQELTTLARLVL